MMNQQEIDRLWDAHCRYESDEMHNEVMDKYNFAQAAAEIRRQALEEAAQVCDTEEVTNRVFGADGYAEECANAIRALAQTEQEKS